MAIIWIYRTVTELVGIKFFAFIGFNPEKYQNLWILIFIVLFLMLLYFVGHLMDTRFAQWVEKLLEKIPGYKTIKDMIGIFNSSKAGDRKVLVVAIAGFGANKSFNVGLMYSQKESIIKDHYTVTLSMSPIPNGGFMFEVHKDDIYVIEGASFDDNLQYLLSMGVKSLAEILKSQPIEQNKLLTLSEYLKRNEK
ncbi:MAG: DUF502 domain-containing protein [Campylobacterales bacterium]|nr:DUF502 domain-containing protein [Campylobacterales bacterium]